MNDYAKNLVLTNAEKTLDKRLLEMRDKYRENGIPTILTESLNELVLLSSALKPKKILELGTSVGCSGIALLLASKGATLYTVEKFSAAADAAAENFKKFGLESRVKQFVGDATEVIDKVGDGFDFVFLDCNKSKYKDLFPKIKNILISGGVLFADNVFYRGYVTGEVKAPHRQNTIKNNMREFLRLITSDEDFITTLSDIGDGISVSYKK